MDERRKLARRRCRLGARVVFDARASILSCVVLNHSDDGALLEFSETPFIPEHVEIVLDNHKTLAAAQIVWRSGMRVGVIFPRGRFLTELREEADRSIAETVGRAEGVSLH